MRKGSEAGRQTMPTRSRDIYGTRERTRPEEPPPPAMDEATWLRKTSRNRWSVAIAVAAFILFAVIFAVILLVQRQMLQAARRAAESPATHDPLPVEVTPRPPLLTIDPEGQLVLDELADLAAALPPDEDGPYPLTPHWIQQAAIQLRLADAAYGNGEWRAALTHYRAAVRILPGIEGLAATMGICALRLRDFEEAERIFTQALETEEERRAALLNNLAVARMGREHYAEAREAIAEAIAEDPEYAPARQNLGVLHFRTGDMEAAAEAFAEAAEVAPLGAEHIHVYAVTLLRLERWAEAAEVLRQSGERYPDAAPIHFRRAEALARKPDPAGAIEALRRAVSLVDPPRAMLWLSRSGYDPLREQPEFQQIVSELTQPRR